MSDDRPFRIPESTLYPSVEDEFDEFTTNDLPQHSDWRGAFYKVPWAVDADSITVVCADGRFKVTRVQADGPKVGAGEWAKSANIATGARLT